jgi:hypothetical protein
MSYSTNAGRRRRHHFYDEFANYYEQQRCQWAPPDPRRAFLLAFEGIYPAYRRRVPPEQLLALVYDTLGVRRGKPRGLFQTFDPNRYAKKSLPLEEHFLNSFAVRLKGRVKNHLRREAGRGRLCDPTKLHRRADLKLVGTAQRTPAERELLADLPVALERLEGEEHLVVHLSYWDDLSAREIGLALRKDHKTVGQLREAALGKLRRYLEEKSASPEKIFPTGAASR